MYTAKRLTRSVRQLAKGAVSTPIILPRYCPRCTRHFSLSAPASESQKNEGDSGSLFDSTKSSWDHVFSNIEDMPPLLPSHLHRDAQKPRQRKQTMTAREIDAFDDMFNMIFNAVSEQKRTMPNDRGVGIGRGGLGDLFGKLRRHSRRMKWTTEADHVLDRKKEAMDLCDTDQQLLDWAMRDVFGEYEKFEREMQDSEANSKESLAMISATYPHLIALLMRSFRDKYGDPHLAMSIFDHARHLSIASYVFGCTTMAYNELIETRWNCFRDVKGVHDALVEMSVNGVDMDPKTHRLVEKLRREVGERNLWVEEDVMGSGETWSLLNKIEDLIASEKTQRMGPSSKERSLTSQGPKWDQWKTQAMNDDENDEWGFGKWDDIPLRH